MQTAIFLKSQFIADFNIVYYQTWQIWLNHQQFILAYCSRKHDISLIIFKDTWILGNVHGLNPVDKHDKYIASISYAPLRQNWRNVSHTVVTGKGILYYHISSIIKACIYMYLDLMVFRRI